MATRRNSSGHDALAEQARPKRCFVATPIGEVGSETRHRADQMFKYVLEPVARDCGYAALRADQLPQPGLITSQILQHIVDDDLVIADLTDHNPNVFYELAIRHAVRKPVVQVIECGQSIPFDLAAARTVQIDIHDLDSVADAKRQLAEQIRSQQSGGDLANPISESLHVKEILAQDVPPADGLRELVMVLGQMRHCLADIDGRLRRLERCLDPCERRDAA